MPEASSLGTAPSNTCSQISPSHVTHACCIHHGIRSADRYLNPFSRGAAAGLSNSRRVAGTVLAAVRRLRLFRPVSPTQPHTTPHHKRFYHVCLPTTGIFSMGLLSHTTWRGLRSIWRLFIAVVVCAQEIHRPPPDVFVQQAFSHFSTFLFVLLRFLHKFSLSSFLPCIDLEPHSLGSLRSWKREAPVRHEEGNMQLLV